MSVSEQDFQKMLANMSDENRDETLKLSGLSEQEAKESWLEAAFKPLLKQHFPQHFLALQTYVQSQFRFHPERGWKLDFAWYMMGYNLVRVAVELHGLYAKDGSAGRHLRPLGFSEDRVKMNEAMLFGWKVIEATGEQMKDGTLFRWIERAFNQSPVSMSFVHQIHKSFDSNPDLLMKEQERIETIGSSCDGWIKRNWE